MNIAAILHRPEKRYVYPEGKHKLVFRLTTAQKDCNRVNLICWNRYDKEKTQQRIEMRCRYRDGSHDFYQAEVDFAKVVCYLKYCFELLPASGEPVFYGPCGAGPSEKEASCFEFLYANESDGYHSPAWAREQIYYQIFPERFCPGNRAHPRKELAPWGAPPTRDNFMGGSLRGITQKLDYISDLGVTCLYLTPVFKGTSNHKYDTEDYFSIDPDFGNKEDLAELVRECHARGMKIILDGVFNHCGYYFPPFQDVLKNGEASPYRGWFFAESFPVRTDPPNYECVGYYKWMPKLNLSNPETREYFLRVGRYWVKEFHTDGWRLDVSDEVESDFWEAFRCAVKSVAPQAVLIGETWGDAVRLVEGNRLDAAMNYLFRDAVTDWIAKEQIDTLTFDHRINAMLARYNDPTVLCMYNPLDSHDTARFLFECGGDVRKLRLAVAFQMTFPGCPAVFYGDEIGLSGGNDPGCRLAMEWTPEKQDVGLLEWYRKLAAIRKELPALSRGEFASAFCDNITGVYGYIRSCKGQRISIVLNRSGYDHTVRVPVWESDAVFTELLTGERIRSKPENGVVYNRDITGCEGMLTTTVPAYSVKIFQSEESGEKS